MTLRRLLLFAGAGGFLYAHGKRGGQMTLASFKETARDLMDNAKLRARSIKSQAEQKLEETRAATVESAPAAGEDVTGYGSAGYGYGTSGDVGKH